VSVIKGRSPSSYHRATHPHGNVDVTLVLFNLLPDLAQSLLHQLDRRVLIRTSRAHHIERRSDQSDLDGYLFGGQGFSSPEGGLDTVDTLVRVTSEFEIRSDLDGLGGESSGDGGEEFRADFGGHVEGFKDGVGFAIARDETQVFPVSTTWRLTSRGWMNLSWNSRNGELESIVSVSILLSQGPDDALVQSLGIDVTLLGDLLDDRVDGLPLFVLLLALDDLFRRYSSL
jgi:hypothetical protein